MLNWELAPHCITSQILIDSSSQRAHPHPRGWKTKPHLLMQQGHIAERHVGWEDIIATTFGKYNMPQVRRPF